jgi:ribosomal protein S27AE
MNSRAQIGEPMTCPRCGAKMNHHADKTLYFTEADETCSVDLAESAVVDEIHACPKCGAASSRLANC